MKRGGRACKSVQLDEHVVDDYIDAGLLNQVYFGILKAKESFNGFCICHILGTRMESVLFIECLVPYLLLSVVLI